MSIMRDLTSMSIHEIGRDVVNDESRSATTGSSGSVGPRKTMKKKRFNAPRCYCGTHAILFLSSTELNPNRLFYGCPNFKSSGSHCKYFAWLDDFVALLDFEGSKSLGFDSGKQLEDQHVAAAEMLGGKVRELEHTVHALELQVKRCKHVHSEHRCFRGATVVAFFCGVIVANIVRTLS
ncbi:uncharacterized protein [Arachis hypogaea]|uniref:GRF-type domain-containing protein n=1 Tax=Arachis hypogaea TaxID=3818 RepID=A0A6B9VDF9_ARAHY|nr:uncharacterized protein DS421_19g663710 [Arachis hypogaea]